MYIKGVDTDYEIGVRSQGSTPDKGKIFLFSPKRPDRLGGGGGALC